MTRVLLITDTERVQRIFESLETNGSLHLRTAATLDQADLEISASVPDFTFVQSRVSGFSGEIQLRHLRKVLPKGAKAILLAGDAEDAAQAKKERRAFIDLTLDDAAFEASVARALTGARSAAPKKSASAEAPTGKKRAAKVKTPDTPPEPLPEEISDSSSTLPYPELPASALPDPEQPEFEQPVAKQHVAELPEPELVEPELVEPELPVAEQQVAELPEPEVPEPVAPEEPALPVDISLLTLPVFEKSDFPVASSAPEDLEEAEEPFLQEPAAEVPARQTPEPLPQEAQETRQPVQDEPPAEQPTTSVFAKHSTQPFEEMLQLGADKHGSPLPDPRSVEDRVQFGAPAYQPIEPIGTPVGSYEHPAKDPLPEGYIRGIPLADAMARAEKEKRHYWWLLPVLLAFAIIPLWSYNEGQKKAPVYSGHTSASRSAKRTGKAPLPASAKAALPAANPPANQVPPKSLAAIPAATPGLPPGKAPTATVPVKVEAPAKPAMAAAMPAKPVVATAIPAKAPATASVTQPIVKPEVRPAAKPEANPAVPPEVKPAVQPLPVAKTGIKSLPPVVANAKLDGSYGKTHPGWQRYSDRNAEYTVFKEDNVFRAMQVVSLGKEPVPNQLFKRLLLEFGGIKRFELQSSVDKGDYLMERGVAKGGLSLTIYRRKKDFKVKGMVIYYQ